jgi:hypothetical protein
MASLMAMSGLLGATNLTVTGFYSTPQTVTSLNSTSCQGTTTGSPLGGDANCTLTDWMGSVNNNTLPYASISIAQFNVANATLNSISVDFMGAMESTYSLTNTTSTTVNSYQSSLVMEALALNAVGPYTPLQTSGSGTPCLVQETDHGSTFCDTGVAPTIVTLAPGTYAAGTIGPTTVDAYADSGSVTLGSTAGWIGSGNVIVPVAAIVATNFNGSGGNFTLSQTTDAVGELSVTYNYTLNPSTPEPTTMVLFGSALIGLGVLRKRVRNS